MGCHALIVHIGRVEAQTCLPQAVLGSNEQMLLKDDRLTRIIDMWARSAKSVVAPFGTVTALIAEPCIDIENEAAEVPRKGDQLQRVLRSPRCGSLLDFSKRGRYRAL